MFSSLRRSRSLLVVLLVSLFSFSMIVGCGQNESTNAESDQSTTGSSEVAIKVGSESITQAEFKKRIDQRLQQFKQSPRMKKQLQRLPKSKRKAQMKRMRGRLKQQLSRQLETQLLLDHHVKQANISVSDEEVQAKMDELKQQQPQLEQMMKQQGRSMDSLRGRIREQLKLQKFVDQKVGEISVSEEEARQYYEENKEQFSQSERVKARHILISDTSAEGKAKAQSLKDEIDQGADFAEVAREESDGPSAKRGGNLDYITRDEMVKPFTDAAFALDAGEVSDPVKTRYGWHLIKVDDRKEASEASYEDVSDTIVEQVKQRRKKQKFQKILRQLRQETEIVNNVKSSMPKQRGRRRPAPQGQSPQGQPQQ